MMRKPRQARQPRSVLIFKIFGFKAKLWIFLGARAAGGAINRSQAATA
jgi:hypothetical protein